MGKSDVVDERAKKFAGTIRSVFEGQDLPFVLGLALAHRETLFVSTPNLTGGDGARGGAWGIFQVTLQTAQGYGFDKSGPHLAETYTNALYATKVLTEAVKKWNITFDSKEGFRDAASAYNCWRPYKNARVSTKLIYIPRFMKSLEWAHEWVNNFPFVA